MRWFTVLCLAMLVLESVFTTSTRTEATETVGNQLTAQEIEQGWIQLFDGESLFGWKANNDIPWKVSNGAIEASTGDPGLLLTTTQFSDYELRCDFWMAPGGNSGIFLQSEFLPKDPTVNCYELNICDTHPSGFNTGSFVGLAKPTTAITGGDEKWHTFHVLARGNHLTVKLDGKEVLDYTNPKPGARRSGFIGLQKNAGLIRFRNVFLKPLGGESLFNGKDLAGWRVVPGGVSEFTVKDQKLHVKNGRGYLETEKAYGDFLLQADSKTNGQHLNSGIFFRALPGTKENPADGYECQIRHQWEGSDRNKPVDFGTGGIYRRIPTRRVVADDNKWCTMTIAAQGPHIAVWVNGFPTTDWTDTRKPNPNPRQGLRVEPGHISLQGHDPTTDLEFRNLRIKPWMP